MNAWLISFAASVVISSFGIHNRRTGWQRHRSDLVLDTLVNWAVIRKESQSDDSPARPAAAAIVEDTPVQSPAATATTDLAALAAALGSSMIVSAQPATGKQAKLTPTTVQSR